MIGRNRAVQSLDLPQIEQYCAALNANTGSGYVTGSACVGTGDSPVPTIYNQPPKPTLPDDPHLFNADRGGTPRSVGKMNSSQAGSPTASLAAQALRKAIYESRTRWEFCFRVEEFFELRLLARGRPPPRGIEAGWGAGYFE